MTKHHVCLVDNLVVACEHTLKHALISSEGELIELFKFGIVVTTATACPKVVGKHVLAKIVVVAETSHLEIACNNRIFRILISLIESLVIEDSVLRDI